MRCRLEGTKVIITSNNDQDAADLIAFYSTVLAPMCYVQRDSEVELTIALKPKSTDVW